MDVLPRTRIWVKDGKVHVHQQQDSEPILELNARQRATPPRRYAGHSFRQVGRIPNLYMNKIITEYGPGFMRLSARERQEIIKEGCRRLLADPDYSKFRTVDKI